MDITIHTEPSVSPPEFSVICRTEGGPATYATWFVPNDENSDPESSQIIVNTSRNSVYENRLQVRGRNSGTYQCSVHNNRHVFLFNEIVNFVNQYANVMG